MGCFEPWAAKSNTCQLSNSKCGMSVRMMHAIKFVVIECQHPRCYFRISQLFLRRIFSTQQRCGWTKQLSQPTTGGATWSLQPPGSSYPWNMCGDLPSDLATPCAAWQDLSCSAASCKSWADLGDCMSNPDYMLKMCMPQCCQVGPQNVV